ncbi:unnamed protein product [Citrullus colocynthis]|uniref:Uncharacterized protein n=1 Tax=Citrullus colocynthis TaxID=252529 RepID=A0ABP0Z160_9ROSI
MWLETCSTGLSMLWLGFSLVRAIPWRGFLYLIWPPAFPDMMLNAILSVLFNAMGQEIQLPLFLTCTAIPSV